MKSEYLFMLCYKTHAQFSLIIHCEKYVLYFLTSPNSINLMARFYYPSKRGSRSAALSMF